MVWRHRLSLMLALATGALTGWLATSGRLPVSHTVLAASAIGTISQTVQTPG